MTEDDKANKPKDGNDVSNEKIDAASFLDSADHHHDHHVETAPPAPDLGALPPGQALPPSAPWQMPPSAAAASSLQQPLPAARATHAAGAVSVLPALPLTSLPAAPVGVGDPVSLNTFDAAKSLEDKIGLLFAEMQSVRAYVARCDARLDDLSARLARGAANGLSTEAVEFGKLVV